MRIFSSLFSLLLLLSPCIRAAILAIDYGAEFTKLSLVKPGVPFDVILDRDSKRKIQSVVGWKREDRVFGAEGKMAVSQVVCPFSRVSRQADQELKLRLGNEISRYPFPLCETLTWRYLPTSSPTLSQSSPTQLRRVPGLPPPISAGIYRSCTFLA